MCASRWSAACTTACPPLPHCTASLLPSHWAAASPAHGPARTRRSGESRRAAARWRPTPTASSRRRYKHCRTLRRHCQALEHAAAVPPHSITASQPPGRGLSGPTRRLHSDQGASSAAPPHSHTAARQQGSEASPDGLHYQGCQPSSTPPLCLQRCNPATQHHRNLSTRRSPCSAARQCCPPAARSALAALHHCKAPRQQRQMRRLCPAHAFSCIVSAVWRREEQLCGALYLEPCRAL